MGWRAGIESGSIVQQQPGALTTKPSRTLAVKDKSSYYRAKRTEYTVIIKENFLRIPRLIPMYRKSGFLYRECIIYI